MSIFDKLTEGIFKLRIIPKENPSDKTSFVPESEGTAAKVQEAVDAGKRIDLTELTNLTTLKGDRNSKYAAFEEMATDGRIAAALEIYANDCVQYNQQGKVIWAESDDSDVARYVNDLLNDLNIPQNLWSYAYCMWLYGDVYLETFINTSEDGSRPTLLLEPVDHSNNVKTQKHIKGGKLERYIQKVSNPADVYDLQYKGKTSGFIRSKDNIDCTQTSKVNQSYLYAGNATDVSILSPTKFVHICLSPNINRFPETFKLIKDDKKKDEVNEDGYIDGSDEEGSGGDLSFTVKTGQSVLENVYGAYQTLKLKEDSVLLERITKSSITRIIQVELGDLPESKKRQKLQEIKNQIEQQLIMNKDAGSLQSRAGAQPIENIIYTTTKDGKGTISTVNIGGDADIGNMDDVEQSEDKLYGSLLIPKALLGSDMEGSGLSNGGSLTEMNTTYARRIKRGQMALITAITDLVNIFALGDMIGKKVIGNYQIKLTPIITVEDNRRDELMQTKIRNINDMMSLINDMESLDENTKLQMIISWLSTYLNQQDIVDIINQRLKDLENKEDEEKQDDIDKSKDDRSDNDIDINFSGSDSFGPPPSSPDFEDLGNDEDEDLDLENSEETSTSEESTTPEVAEETNLADIEGQDLL